MIDLKDTMIINSTVRVFRLLECFLEGKGTFTLTELANKLGIPLGTVQRITYTMEKLGYLQRVPVTKAYELTAKWLPFGKVYLDKFDLRKIALPQMLALTEETGETTNLAILDGDEIVYLERVQTSHVLRTSIRPGDRRPAWCTSIGKVFLAFMKENERDRIINRIKFVKYTSKTIPNKTKLKKQLQIIKDQGYSDIYGEMTPDIFSIAVPILDADGYAIAGINIVIPVTRVQKNKVYKKYLPSLIKKRKEISKSFGSN